MDQSRVGAAPQFATTDDQEARRFASAATTCPNCG
jgi:hypothetical protein